MSDTDITVGIHIRNGAVPKAGHGPNGIRWLDLDSRALGLNLFAPGSPHVAIAYLNALIGAVTELRDDIAADAGLTALAA